MRFSFMKYDETENRKAIPEEFTEEDFQSPYPQIFAGRNDALYQIMRGNDCIYVISAGSKLFPKLKRTIETPEDFQSGSGRRKIDFVDIEAVNISIEEDGAHIRLKTWSKTFRWDTDAHTPEEIKALFDGLPMAFKDKVNDLSPDQREQKERLERICRVLRIASWISGLLFLFLARPYRALATINIAIPAAFLVIYALNLNRWSLFGYEKRESLTFGCWCVSMCAIIMRAFVDFNFPSPVQLVLPMLVVAAAGIAVFFVLSIGQAKKIKSMLCMLLCIALYTPGATVMLNYLLPVKNVRTYTASVLDKKIHKGSRSPERYNVTILTQVGEIEVYTTQEIYDILEIGGEAAYIQETSLLGIDFGDVYPSYLLVTGNF